MEEKPKVTKNPRGGRGRGFYVAMYSSLGGLLVLAIAIGYYNFIGFGSSTAETHVAELRQDDLWLEVDSYPVGNNWDEPLTGSRMVNQGQPAQTPPPQQQVPPSPSPNEGARGGEPSPSPVASPQAQAQASATPTPGTTPNQTMPPEGGDDDWNWDWETGEIFQDEIYLADEEFDEDIFDVFDAAQAPQTFTHFTAEDNMHWPVLGDVVMDFAMDRLIYDITLDQWRTNDNLAIAADRGDAVRAAASGVVSNILDSRQFGPTVVIDHGNGWITTYSQLDPDTVVSIGDVVTRGQIIGSVGSPSIFGSLLGYHVNFAITNDDAPIDPNTLLTIAD